MIRLLIIFAAFFCCESVIVQTQYGPIRGANRVSALNKNYVSFQKIPYMKPPVGTLRFRNAEIPDNWTQPLDCTQEGPRFPQIDLTFEIVNGVFAGDLDSMHINVYTNDLNPPRPYPVLVWIHGGGFRTGSAGTDIYGPDYFVEKNVVLVSFNYRLQAFGFLSLDDPELEIPGNAGLKDQVLALKWIKENIHQFGGDAQNITIFGQSSGGGCAHYHIISDASKDLFQRSIIMSGSAFNNMYAAVPRRNWALRLSLALNYTGPGNDRSVLEFLELAEPEAIFTAVGTLMTFEEREVERLLNAFGPTIEPYPTDTAFMLDHPERLAVDSWGNNVDILIGATANENLGLVNVVRLVPPALASFTDFSTFVPSNLNFTDEQREESGQTLKAMYYGLMEPTVTNVDGVIFMSNDFAFVHSIHRVVKQRWESGGSGKSFVYRFDVNSDNNCFSTLYRIDPLYREPIHMDDLCHLFKPVFAPVPQLNSVGWNTTQLMLSIFTDFAATGNPGVDGWRESTGANDTAPLYGYNIRETDDFIGEFPETRRMEVWDTFYENYTNKATSLVKVFNLSLFLFPLIKFIA